MNLELTQAGWLRAWLAPLLLTALFAAGCERDTKSLGATSHGSAKPASLVEFPDEVHADDPEVNAFVLQAIDVCLAEDYDAFRLLWTALDQPLGEQEFRKGFAATRKVTIRELAKRRTREGEIVYVVYCLVDFDPGAVPEPTRDIVLLLRKENDKWRIAKAPAKETQALKKKYATKDSPSDANTTGTVSAGASQP